jgi:hypothetical protein
VASAVVASAKEAANTCRKDVAHAEKMMQLHQQQRQLRTTHTSSHRFINYQSSTTTAIPNPNSGIEQWKSRYSELQPFITTYGTYNVLTRSLVNGKYKSLCGWWNRQRTHYTKYKFGSKSTLGEEHIRLFDNLNDHWRSSSSSSSSSTTKGVGGGRGGDGDGVVRGKGRVRGGGSCTKKCTIQRLWKASNADDSETDEDENTRERIEKDNDDEDEDDEEDDEYVDDVVYNSSTEEEEAEIDFVDSFSDQSRSASVDNSSDGQHRNGATRRKENRTRGAVYPSGKSTITKQ